MSANYALLYVSYLTQVIGRNCRYLFVVIVGAFFSRVKKGSALKIHPKKILVATIITVGVLLFTIMKVVILSFRKTRNQKIIWTALKHGKDTSF